MRVHRLVYVSRSCLPEECQDQIVADIVEVARERNNREGITGVLLFTGDSFLQVLEGEEHAVDALMTDIMRDPGHSDVDILLQGEALEREFEQWSMAYWRCGSYAARLLENVRFHRRYPPKMSLSLDLLLTHLKTVQQTTMEADTFSQI